jgi:hypothetical protein
MPSPSRSWINKSALSQLAQVAQAYKKMASVNTVEQAATHAGVTMASSMTNMVQSQPDLSSYADVIAGFTAWAGPDTVHVGIPEDNSPLLKRAQALEEEFPLMETILDMEAQTGDTQRAFYDSLASQVGLRDPERH